MIQDFKTYIEEGTLWGNTIMRSDTNRVRKEDEFNEDYVLSFVDDGFEENIDATIIKKINGKIIVDIEGGFTFREDITEIPFQFGTISDYIELYKCDELTSLEGCPKKVGGGFDCSCCIKLTSLEGCPQKVGGDFFCSNCSKLTSLEGCPKEVSGNFYCGSCGESFTENEVRQYCNVKGRIYV